MEDKLEEIKHIKFTATSNLQDLSDKHCSWCKFELKTTVFVTLHSWGLETNMHLKCFKEFIEEIKNVESII